MLSLSDTVEPDHGGFECVAGFHREFQEYFHKQTKHTVEDTVVVTAASSSKPSSTSSSLLPPRTSSSSPAASLVSASKGRLKAGKVTCVGDYCAIQPGADAEVLRRFRVSGSSPSRLCTQRVAGLAGVVDCYPPHLSAWVVQKQFASSLSLTHIACWAACWYTWTATRCGTCALQTVPVPAGAAVFWDQRLPHANARCNKSGGCLLCHTKSGTVVPP
jgi:hypothetical protein